MSNNNKTSYKEKRKYFRVDDIALISYRVVSWEEVRSIENLDHSLSISKHTLKANLDSISRELQPLYNVIKSSSSNIACYLSMLDKKINIISEYLMRDDDDDEMRLYHINLGAGGFSFISDKYFTAGATLELQLKLLPENTVIYSYAKVVTCAQQSDDIDTQTYKSAVEFEFMDDDVRDMITRHVLDKERSLLNASSR